MLLTRYAQIATTQDKAKSYLVRVRPPADLPFSISLPITVAPLPMT